MSKRAISDTGPLLHLGEVGALRHMSIFERIVVSQFVAIELERHGVLAEIQESLGKRLHIVPVDDADISAQREILGRCALHHTDLSVAALASRFPADIVLTDDLRLRRGLEQRGLPVVGSIGVLFRAFQSGKMKREELVAILNTLMNGSTLYLSRGLRDCVLHRLDDL